MQGMKTLRVVAVACALLVTLAACGGEPELSLTPAGEAGRMVALDNGCASCHGKNGQGVTAPSWQGIYNEPIPLKDGTTVIGDDEYLFRSIREPQAELVKGWTIKMPANQLTDAEIASVIDFIKELT